MLKQVTGEVHLLPDGRRPPRPMRGSHACKASGLGFDQEVGQAVVAPLHDVLGDAGEIETCQSHHVDSVARGMTCGDRRRPRQEPDQRHARRQKSGPEPVRSASAAAECVNRFAWVASGPARLALAVLHFARSVAADHARTPVLERPA